MDQVAMSPITVLPLYLLFIPSLLESVEARCRGYRCCDKGVTDCFTKTGDGKLCYCEPDCTYRDDCCPDYKETCVLLDPEEHFPGDRFVMDCLNEATRRVDTVINRNKEIHDDPNRVVTPFDFLSMFGQMSPGAQREARAGKIAETTIQLVGEEVNARRSVTKMIEDLPAVSSLISPEQLNTIASLSGCARSVTRVNCSSDCLSSKYRTIDGTCNNRENPLWGSSLTPFKRFLPPIYENQWNEPVGWNKSREYNGFTLPSVRHVSNKLMTTAQNVDDPDYTHMLTQWGQFLDHDTDLTATAVGRTMFTPGMNSTSCEETCDNIMPCFPIPIPDDDPRIDNVLEKACMPFTRSSAVCGTGETSSLFNTAIAREQINQVTSFIDASNVYGSTLDVAQSLRDFSTDDGLLRVQEGADISSGMDLLPFQDEEVSSCNQDPNGGDIVPCFLAGDTRNNEVNTLIASHTTWVREHNRLARELKSINPHWDGEQIYQEARKIVGSEMQHITFTEYLPKILGQRGMDQMGEHTGYDPNVNPSTRNEFATAAFRFGHAAISGTVRRFDENYEEDPVIGNVALHDAFFSPWRIMRESGIDPVVRGLIGGSAKLVTPTDVMHEELSQKLFALMNQIALDLASLNTQRGRDHGLPFYNDWRVFCNLPRAESFDDLSGEISNSDVRGKLADVYGDVNNIDLWPAALLEDHEDGARVGPTFRCMMAEQFKALRDGDRFWYQSDGVFTPAQRAEISRVTLARVICDNTGITRLPRDVFRLTDVADMVACEDIPGINLQFWEEIPADEPCGEPAEVENAHVQKCGANSPDIHIYTCDPGYAMSGAAEFRCLGGVPDNPPPACSDEDGCSPNPCHPKATCTDNPAPDVGATCVCEDGYIGDGLADPDGTGCKTCPERYPKLHPSGTFGIYQNQCFWYSPRKHKRRLTYEKAKLECESNRGTLAMIKDDDMQTFMLSLLKKKRQRKYWIGLDDIYEEEKFMWNDGTKLGGYNKFKSNSPHEIRDCVSLWRTNKLSRWYCVDCELRLPYICQLGGTKK
ncbi:eosinophil peroxidase-like [Branchiostoma floridae x Branchiostoma japonicum]